jgi:hypothetical protein
MSAAREVVAYIPTRARAHLLKKVLPKWEKQNNVGAVILVVEPWEGKEMMALARPYDKVWVEILPRFDRGIAYARQRILRIAKTDGLDRIIMCDDDLYPSVGQDVSKLLEFPEGEHPTLGMGASLSFYGLTFGNDTLRERHDPLLCYNALGKRLFGIDVNAALEIGGYDIRLHSFGSDNDIVRQGAKDLQSLWYVHAGMKATSIGKRYEPGGIEDLAGDRHAREVQCHEIMYGKWPKYVTPPTSRFMCKWKKLMDDFIPDWKESLNWQKEKT